MSNLMHKLVRIAARDVEQQAVASWITNGPERHICPAAQLTFITRGACQGSDDVNVDLSDKQTQNTSDRRWTESFSQVSP